MPSASEVPAGGAFLHVLGIYICRVTCYNSTENRLEGETVEIFKLTLNQMLMMFTLIAVGVLLRKTAVLNPHSGNIMARMETYIFVPALLLYTQMTKCTVATFVENTNIILYGFALAAGGIALAYLLAPLFVPKGDGSTERDYQRNIYRYAMAFGNFGFMGNFIVLGVWGTDVFYQYTLFTLSFNILCYSWGLYVLVPKDRNVSVWANLKKGLLTPPIITLAVSIVCGLLGVAQYLPDFLITAFEKAGDCQGPVAMVLAGFVIGGYNFGELLKNGKVYVATLLRLIVIPAAAMLVLKAIGANDLIQTLALIVFATPLGLNTIVYPAAYGGDTKTGASMAMISHVLSVITIPLMYLIFIVWL